MKGIFTRFFFVLCTALIPMSAWSAAVNFSGELGFLETDTGGGIYSGTALGTVFSGFIDDVTAHGEISDGITATPFSCCIAAGAMEVTNDVSIDAAGAAQLNTLAGFNLFTDGDVIDIIDLEGDAATPGGGRIEVGLSWVFAGSTFANEDLSNYPFDPNDLLLGLFFILEEDINDDEVYSAQGAISVIPLPPAIALFLPFALTALGLARRS